MAKAKKASVAIANATPKSEVIDRVNPPHYKDVGIDALSVMDINNQSRDFCVGNILKYTMRHQMKNGIEDLRKARWYLNFLIAKDMGMNTKDAVSFARIPHPGE